MSNVRIIASDTLRMVNGLSICPACKFSADHGITPHLCITGAMPVQALDADTAGLIADLEAHPAQPLVWAGEHHEIPVLRAVDRTWCVCAHSTTPPVAGPGEARS